MNALKARVIVMDHGEETENFMCDKLAELLNGHYTLLDSIGIADICLLQ